MEIDRDGVKVHYEVAGSGPALLLTHGFTASGHMFAANVPALAAHNSVITWDMRGHGRSGYPTDPAAYSPELSIGDMVALLDAGLGMVDQWSLSDLGPPRGPFPSAAPGVERPARSAAPGVERAARLSLR